MYYDLSSIKYNEIYNFKIGERKTKMNQEELQFVVKLIALDNALENVNKVCTELYHAFDNLMKRGEHNATTQRDTEPSKDIQTKGSK